MIIPENGMNDLTKIATNVRNQTPEHYGCIVKELEQIPMPCQLIHWKRRVCGAVSHFKRAIGAFLYPSVCSSCGTPDCDGGALFCGECLQLLELLEATGRCRCCFLPQRQCRGRQGSLARCAAVFEYRDAAAALVQSYKYGGQRQLAEGLAAWMVVQLIRLDWPLPDLLVPVPMALTRRLTRGYDQSYLLAEAMGRQLSRPVVRPLVRKSGDYSQAALSHRQRMGLGDNTFYLKRTAGQVTGLRLLLIDDVMTTRATLRACSRTLAAAHPAEVAALTLCETANIVESYG